MTGLKSRGKSFHCTICLLFLFASSDVRILNAQSDDSRPKVADAIEVKFHLRPKRFSTLKVDAKGGLFFQQAMITRKSPLPNYLVLVLDKGLGELLELDSREFKELKEGITKSLKEYGSRKIKDLDKYEKNIERLERRFATSFTRKERSAYYAAVATADFYRYGPVLFAKMYGGNEQDLRLIRKRLSSSMKSLREELRALSKWSFNRCNRGIARDVMSESMVTWENHVDSKYPFSVSSAWIGANDFVAKKSDKMGMRVIGIGENGVPYVYGKSREQLYLNLVKLIATHEFDSMRKRFFQETLPKYEEEYAMLHQDFKKNFDDLGDHKATETLIEALDTLAFDLFHELNETEAKAIRQREVGMRFRIQGPTVKHFESMYKLAGKDSDEISWAKQRNEVRRFVEELEQRSFAIEKKVFEPLFEGCSKELKENTPWKLATPKTRPGVAPLEFAIRHNPGE